VQNGHTLFYMKTKNQTIHDMNTTTQNQPRSNPPVTSVLKLVPHMDLKQITVTIQTGHQHPKSTRRFSAVRLIQWTQNQVRTGRTV
jgi:hypothetical protein